jgi:hypothetical protein
MYWGYDAATKRFHNRFFRDRTIPRETNTWAKLQATS